MLQSPQALLPPGNEAAYTHDSQSDRVTEAGAEGLVQANLRAPPLRPTAKTLPKRADEEAGEEAGEEATPSPNAESVITPRDRGILAALSRLRILSYGQIRRRFFPGKSIEAVGQRMRKLAWRGLVSLWQDPVVRGGRPSYALPTAEGLRLGTDEVRSTARGTPFERLVDLMLPKKPRQPLVLETGMQPPFLPHQRECNHLALGFGEMKSAHLLFASTLERPFPNTLAGLAMPQPDLVMVFDIGGTPRLVFCEHDRGQESLTHFRSAKVEKYAELAVRPELVEELFGFGSFEVWVTVLDKRFRRPIDRLRALSGEAAKAGAEYLFSFALAGWAHDNPDGVVWFVNGNPPEADSHALRDHASSRLVSVATERRPGRS
ncbi:MAG: replication-relaxation family protein [Thermoanaerobaculia bacterium]